MYMTTHARRVIASAAALVAVVAVLAPATAGASSGTTVKLKGEATTLQTDPATTKALISNGGLEFVNVANGHTLKLTNFQIRISAHPGLTAAVNGDPKTRVRILNLDLSTATIVKHPPTVKVNGVKATLTSTAASALNSSLGVHLFSAGITLGTANVDAHIA